MDERIGAGRGCRGEGEGFVRRGSDWWAGGEGRRGAGVKRDGRARMLEAKRTVETGSVFLIAMT